MNLYSAFFPILTHLWGLKADDAHQENSQVDLYCWVSSLILYDVWKRNLIGEKKSDTKFSLKCTHIYREKKSRYIKYQAIVSLFKNMAKKEIYQCTLPTWVNEVKL